MISRERVRKAINRTEPDRVPIDIGGTKVTGIHMDEYIGLGEYLGVDVAPPKVYEQFVMLARIDELIRQRLHADVIEIENPIETWGFLNNGWKTWENGKGNNVLVPAVFDPERDGKTGYYYIKDKNGKIIASMPPDGLYFERYCNTQISDEIIKMDPDEWEKSLSVYGDGELTQMEKTAKYYYEYTDYSLHGGFAKGKMGSSGLYAGLNVSDWMITLILDPDYAFAILNASARNAVRNLEVYLQAVGKYIDTILVCGTDFGSQRCELINPDLFKRLYVPNIKLMNDYVHGHSNAKTMFHSCGSVRNLIQHFIDGGVDILNPVQVEAEGMDPIELKNKYGNDMVFWGGAADPQSTFLTGTTEQVREQVKDRLRAFAPNGGYVCASVHNIQYGIPPANIIAMADAALEFGQYPIA